MNPVPIRLVTGSPVRGTDPILGVLQEWTSKTDTLVLEFPVAFAPGQPFQIMITEPAFELSLRAIGSKRIEPAASSRFEVRARPVNLTRELRARLSAVTSPRGLLAGPSE